MTYISKHGEPGRYFRKVDNAVRDVEGARWLWAGVGSVNTGRGEHGLDVAAEGGGDSHPVLGDHPVHDGADIVIRAGAVRNLSDCNYCINADCER